MTDGVQRIGSCKLAGRLVSKLTQVGRESIYYIGFEKVRSSRSGIHKGRSTGEREVRIFIGKTNPKKGHSPYDRFTFSTDASLIKNLYR